MKHFTPPRWTKMKCKKGCGGHILTPYLQPEMIKECGAYSLPSRLPCVSKSLPGAGTFATLFRPSHLCQRAASLIHRCLCQKFNNKSTCLHLSLILQLHGLGTTSDSKPDVSLWLGQQRIPSTAPAEGNVVQILIV